MHRCPGSKDSSGSRSSLGRRCSLRARLVEVGLEQEGNFDFFFFLIDTNKNKAAYFSLSP